MDGLFEFGWGHEAEIPIWLLSQSNIKSLFWNNCPWTKFWRTKFKLQTKRYVEEQKSAVNNFPLENKSLLEIKSLVGPKVLCGPKFQGRKVLLWGESPFNWRLASYGVTWSVSKVIKPKIIDFQVQFTCPQSAPSEKPNWKLPNLNLICFLPTTWSFYCV